MADSRLSYTETLAVLDNIAWLHQKVKDAIDGGFNGEGSSTLLYGLRALVETQMRSWTSDSAIRDVVPSAVNTLKTFDVLDSSGTTRMLSPYVEPILRGVLEHHAKYDTTYASFWDWFKAALVLESVSPPNDKVLGEVAELLVGAGIGVDPAHCVAPEYRKVGRLEFTDTETATLTALNVIDPTIYRIPTLEVYCVGRNAAPDEITLTLQNCRNSVGQLADFPLTILETLGATQTMDVPAVDSDTIYSLVGATVEITSGGKDGDAFLLRVKQYREALPAPEE